MIARLVVIVIGCFTVLLVIEVVGPILVGQDDVLSVVGSERLDQTTSQIAAVAAVVDQIVSMFFTAAVGMFVAVGLLVKDAGPMGLRPTKLVAPLFFLTFTAMGIFFGFLARMQVLHSASYSVVPVPGVDDLVGWQGVAVAFSAVAMVIVCYDMLFARD